MPRASWYTSFLRYVPHTVKQILAWIRSRWLYFSKIWFILKELMQNQALFDMFHVLRNEGHYFLHIFLTKFKGSKLSTIFGSYVKSFLIHKLFAICSTHSGTNMDMNLITMIVFQQNLVHIKRAYAKPSSFWYVPCFTKWRTLFSTYFFRLNLREANFPQYLDHMPRASWYTSSLRYVPHTVKQIFTWIRSRWLYFSKIWFILKELSQNQALFDMFHILRNEGHYFPHIISD